jgi:hypothetical protein
MPLIKITTPLFIMLFLTALATVPFSFAAVAAKGIFLRLRQTNRVLAYAFVLAAAAVWIALLFLTALWLVPYWRAFIGI